MALNENTQEKNQYGVHWVALCTGPEGGPFTAVTSGNPIPITPSGTQAVNVTQVGGTAAVTGGVAGSLGVGGLGAAGAAVAGNPVLAAGKDGSGNAQSLSTDAAGRLNLGTAPAALTDSFANPTAPPVGALLLGWNGTTWDRVASISSNLRVQSYDDANRAGRAQAPNDALAPTNYPLSVLTYAEQYNGSSWDRIRNNNDLTLLASAARTATTASADQTNFNARGTLIFLNVTANASAAGIQVQVQFKDPVSGNYVNLTAAPTAVTTTGQFVYELYPGIGAASGGVTQRTSGVLPRTWRVNVIHGDASSVSYSVGASVIL